MKLEALKIEKWFFRKKGDANRFYAVQSTDLTLVPGRLTVLTGRSGSGKTTLLQMLSGILVPSRGNVLADGRDLYEMDDRTLSRFRNEHIGILSQGGDVLPDLTVMENILLPGGISRTKQEKGTGFTERKEYAEALMEQMEIGGLGNVPVRELSGGERRRVCGVRVMAGRPDLIFADEPTSDLDDISMQRMLRLLREAADEGAAVFVVTHDSEALEYADVRLRMNDGVMTSL